MSLIILAFLVWFLACIANIGYALYLSRIAFDRYVRRSYPEVYERLMADAPPPWDLRFDRSQSMWDFRMNSTELSSDARLQVLRSKSKTMFKSAVLMWVSLAATFVVWGVVAI